MTSPNITDYDDTMMPPEMEPAAPSATLVVMITYVIAFILIFFVMGGYLPTPSARISSLEASSSTSDVVGRSVISGWHMGARCVPDAAISATDLRYRSTDDGNDVHSDRRNCFHRVVAATGNFVATRYLSSAWNNLCVLPCPSIHRGTTG